jgi:hypothetical protein
MSTSTRSTRRHRLGNRALVVVAGSLGFAVGAVTLAGALGDDAALPPAADPGISAPTSSIVDGTVDATSTVVATTDETTTVPDSSTPGTTISDSTVPDSSAPDSSAPDTTVPDSTVPASTVPDSTTPSSSLPARSLPAPFTETYDSAGGSITVTWSGTSFSLDSVRATAGYSEEIKDQRWDRIRVEFRGDDDSRIEVRLSDDDNTIRVRID